MKEKIIDARGLPCPRPLIMTKKALIEKSQDEQLIILIDNEISKENVERFLKDNGVSIKIEKENETYKFFPIGILKENISSNNNSIICINSDKMGHGDEALGKILIQAFVNSIGEVRPIPKTIIFYNSGVKLATSDSPVIQSLKKLLELGVDIIVCGTCVEYFKLKDKLSVGKISNMYTILETLTLTNKVIYP